MNFDKLKRLVRNPLRRTGLSSKANVVFRLSTADGGSHRCHGPSLLMPTTDGENARKRYYRQSRSNQCLDVVGTDEDFEHVAPAGPQRVPVSDGISDALRLMPPRKISSHHVEYTRSLEDLSSLEASDDFFLMPPLSGKSTPSMASEEDLRYTTVDDEIPLENNIYKVNTYSSAESIEELYSSSTVTEQSELQYFGDIEMVAGPHENYWKGEITTDWEMRLYRNGDREKVIRLPSTTMLMSEELVLKVNGMVLSAVIEEKPAEKEEGEGIGEEGEEEGEGVGGVEEERTQEERPTEEEKLEEKD